MKKIILLASIFGFLLFGCKDASINPVNPENNLTISQKLSSDIQSGKPVLAKTVLNTFKNSSTELKSELFGTSDDHEIFDLFHTLRISSFNSILITKLIDGTRGSVLSVTKVVALGRGMRAKIRVTARFPRNTFIGEQKITLVVDPVKGSLSFSPHMVFNNPINVDAQIDGVDVSELPSSNGQGPQFMFFGDDGNSEIIQARKVIVNARRGTVFVRGAKLYHFSRYVWAT